MARNHLLAAPPPPVTQALRRVGANLKRARLRRGLTRAHVAAQIGTGLRAVADAEAGKPATGVAVYAALLAALDLLAPFELLADPFSDKEGQALAAAREPQRARRAAGAVKPKAAAPKIADRPTPAEAERVFSTLLAFD